MEKNEFFTILDDVFRENGLSEYSVHRERFYELCNIMLEQNKVMNLSAIRDEKGVICRHFADSLTAAKHIPKGATVLDVGSGGGMPTLPLAIVRDDLHITALDATTKKTAYILSAAKELGLENVSVVSARAEELGTAPEHREKYDVVIARAVAALRVLTEWCAPFAKVGGLFISMKGNKGKTELSEAQNAVRELSLSLKEDDAFSLYDPSASEEDAKRHIFVFEKTAKTDKKYPRKNAQIQKKPL